MPLMPDAPQIDPLLLTAATDVHFGIAVACLREQQVGGLGFPRRPVLCRSDVQPENDCDQWYHDSHSFPPGIRSADPAGPDARAERLSSAAAGEERSDEIDVGWSDLFGVIRSRNHRVKADTGLLALEPCRPPS